MRGRFWLGGVAIVLLSGCQFGGLDERPLALERQVDEVLAAGCSGRQCPLVNIDVQRVLGHPELNALVERSLLALTVELPGDPPPASLETYRRDWLAQARPGWSSYLQAKVLEQHDRLLVIELSSYRFEGGAHGLAGRRYLNYDRYQRRVLTLDDLLLPDRQAAFWALAADAHRQWLKDSGLAEDAAFQAAWPFERTGNIVMLRGALLLKYELARIAPYSSGHPELRIVYPKLNGILRPHYFPGRR